jgi:hypothetical protein
VSAVLTVEPTEPGTPWSARQIHLVAAVGRKTSIRRQEKEATRRVRVTSVIPAGGVTVSSATGADESDMQIATIRARVVCADVTQ